jgi:aquaporin Z
MLAAFKYHWPEYLIEAWCLAAFMVSACFFGVFLFHPVSPFASLGLSLRNILMGIAMGATAVAIIKSPWGQRSGAHFNPAVTLTFLRLGKINPQDAVYYILFQFLGGVVGVLISWIILGDLLSNSAVNFVITVPGSTGPFYAFIAEIVVSFLMMTMILFTSNHARFARFTPIFAGIFIAIFIAIESPISGMSMNPARSFASSVVSGRWKDWWIYFVAPPAAMFAAGEFFIRTRGLKRVLCAKLDHFGHARCIFNCDFSMELS